MTLAEGDDLARFMWWGGWGTARPTLYLGAKGPWVAELQTLLEGEGIDGDWRVQTEAAVRELQARAGLKVDGVCGSATWTAALE